MECVGVVITRSATQMLSSQSKLFNKKKRVQLLLIVFININHFYMKDKKLVTVLVLIIVLLLVGGAYYFGKNGGKINFNNNKFLYSNPIDVLPEDKFMSYEDVSNKFLTKYTDPDHPSVCVNSGIKPEIVILFNKNLNNKCNGMQGCQISITRSATVCGNQYVIGESWLSGPKSYGIFQLN